MTVEQGWGGGEEKDRDRRRRNSQQDGRAQRSRGARSDHENNLPLGGRVELIVRAQVAALATRRTKIRTGTGDVETAVRTAGPSGAGERGATTKILYR